jgi:hypothetical protein
MSMRPLPTKQEPSLVAKLVGIAVSPIIYSIHIGSVLLGWAYTTCSASLQVPTKVLIAVLQIADGLICDLLAIVSKEPGLKAQVGSVLRAKRTQYHTIKLCLLEYVVTNSSWAAGQIQGVDAAARLLL